MIVSKKLLLATLIITGLTAAPRAAGACSCTGEVSFDRAVSSSKQIFRGTAVDVRSAEPEYPMMVWARIAVAQYWKGTPGDTASVLTGANEGVCGFTFIPGVDYLVYAAPYLPGNDVFTHLCARTHQTWDGDPDLAALDVVTPVRKRTWGALKLRFR
jgi:hypothetical protein